MSSAQPSARGTNRIADAFARLGDEARSGLIPYVTAGYPSRDGTLELMTGLASVGADVIELGIPFSDPVADGPTIQRSSQHALDAGIRLDDVLGLLSEFRRGHETPVVVFSYLNPIVRRGTSRFVAEAVAAGADGLLVTDLPVGGDPALEAELEQGPLDLVRLVAPTTAAARIPRIATRSQGFLYYISRTGVTGATGDLRASLGEEVSNLRAHSPVPVAVGFGISSPEQARLVGDVADAVVVGSALIDRIEADDVDEAVSFVGSLRQALSRRESRAD